MIASGVKTKSASMQTAPCAVTIALSLTRKACAGLRKEVPTMGKQHLSRDDRLIMKGKLQGTRENMDMIGMVLQDKFGWHVREETPDGHDTMSLEYLFNCIVELTQEINNGYVKRKDIRKTLAEEYKVSFTEGKKGETE